jgi:hypothetical protein
MRRSFVMSTLACALALAPAVVFAQDPATAAPPKPAEAKVGFTTPAGILLVQIKPTETATFEEMVARLQAGLAKSQDATLKQQAAGFKVFKATEPFGPNALYVVAIEPTVAGAEYELFAMMQKVMTPDELRAPEMAATWKKWADAFAAGLSRLSLTPLGK